MGEAKRSFFRIHLITAIVMALAAGFFVPDIAAYFKPDPFDVPGRAAEISWDLAGTVENLEQSVAANRSAWSVRYARQGQTAAALIVSNSAREEKVWVDISDAEDPPFVIDYDVLYVAHFSHARTGCSVQAYDLSRDAARWEATLMGIGPTWHSEYSNQVNMKLGDGMLVVFGDEANGKYIECVDIKSGNTVGHRAFDLRTPPPGRSYSELVMPVCKMLGAAFAALVVCEFLLRRRRKSVAPVA